MRRKGKLGLRNLENIPPWDWPEDAGETFLGVLRDNQATESDRVLAAELAGDMVVIDDEIARVLLAIACDAGQSEPLRGQAAVSLGPVLEQFDLEGFEDSDQVPITEETFYKIQESFRLLFTARSVPKLVRRRVLEASVRASQDWHRDAVEDAYRSDEEDWKLTAVFCMNHVKGFAEQIVESLASENPEILYFAVRAAGGWGLKAAWLRIAAILRNKDIDKDLLLAAIEGVAFIRPKDAREVLDRHLRSDDEDISEAARDALALAEGSLGEDDMEDERDLDDEDALGLDEGPREMAPKVVPITRPKVGRNEPCPCGSGKKFKKCCGR